MPPTFAFMGDWDWIVRGEHEFWREPLGDHYLGERDYRSVAQMGTAGPASPGPGLFFYDRPVVHPKLEIPLGSNFERGLRLTEKQAIEAKLGLAAGAITKDRLIDVIRELNITGIGNWPAHRGHVRSGYRLSIPGLPVRVERFDATHPSFARTLAIFQSDYARQRLAAITPLFNLRKFTGSTMLRLFGRMSDALSVSILPNPFKLDGWLDPTTSVSDDFNRPDSNGLGVPWVATWPSSDPLNWDVVSNEAVYVGAGNFNQRNSSLRYDSALSSDDMFCEHNWQASGGGGSMSWGPIVRVDNADVGTMYRGRTDDGAEGNNRELFKIIATVATQLGATVGLAKVVGEVERVEIDVADDLIFSVDGVPLITAAGETSITGELYAGLRPFGAAGDTVTIDDWSAGDLVNAAAFAQAVFVH